MSLARNIANAAPAGVFLPFAGTVAPAGWLLCYGQAVSRATYAALFAAIGTTFGAGDGSTTFNLPDLRGRLPAGKDDMGGAAAGRLAVTLTGTRGSTANGNITGLSSTAGLSVGMRAIGTGINAAAVISAITGATTVTLSANNTATGTGSIRFAIVDGATLGASGGDHVHKLTVGQLAAHNHGTALTNAAEGSYGPGTNGLYDTAPSAGGDQAHPNVQPTIIANYIIKT